MFHHIFVNFDILFERNFFEMALNEYHANTPNSGLNNIYNQKNLEIVFLRSEIHKILEADIQKCAKQDAKCFFKEIMQFDISHLI